MIPCSGFREPVHGVDADADEFHLHKVTLLLSGEWLMNIQQSYQKEEKASFDGKKYTVTKPCQHPFLSLFQLYCKLPSVFQFYFSRKFSLLYKTRKNTEII